MEHERRQRVKVVAHIQNGVSSLNNPGGGPSWCIWLGQSSIIMFYNLSDQTI